MKRWNSEIHGYDESNKVDNFINEIISVYEKHGMGIAHEDYHGAFIIKPLDEELKKWIRDSHVDFSGIDLRKPGYR